MKKQVSKLCMSNMVWKMIKVIEMWEIRKCKEIG